MPSQDYSQSAFGDYALNHHLTPFVAVENHYNLLYREDEHELFPALKVCLVCRIVSAVSDIHRSISVSLLYLGPQVHTC